MWQERMFLFYKTAQKFLEKPTYELHDVYRALSVLAQECDLIQSEVYKNSHFPEKRNDRNDRKVK